MAEGTQRPRRLSSPIVSFNTPSMFGFDYGLHNAAIKCSHRETTTAVSEKIKSGWVGCSVSFRWIILFSLFSQKKKV